MERLEGNEGGNTGKKRETKLQITLHRAEKMIEEKIKLDIIFKAVFLLENLNN